MQCAAFKELTVISDYTAIVCNISFCIFSVVQDEGNQSDCILIMNIPHAHTHTSFLNRADRRSILSLLLHLFQNVKTNPGLISAYV